MPDYHNLTPEQRVTFAATMANVIGIEVPNAYGVPGPQVVAVQSGGTTLQTDLTNVATSKQAWHQAVTTKNVQDKNLLKFISQVAKTCYANPAVTDAMLAAIGLAPRQKPHVASGVNVPMDLFANANVDGTVVLKWKRNGNPQGTTFIIEQQSGEGDWTFVTTSSPAKIKLDGYTPGVTVNFRVKARRLNETSPASAVASIYGPGGAAVPQLKVA